jgi:thiamine biosynthesis lipoprotein
MNFYLKIKSVIIGASLIFAMVGICACGNGNRTEKYTEYLFDYFDTVTTITGYEDSQELFDQTYSEIEALLREYHQLFTTYDRYEGINNILTINELHDGVHVPVKVDKKIIDMLSFAKDMYFKTNGKVNIAMGSVLSVWHDYRTEGVSLPPEDKLKTAAEHTDINDLIIDTENSTVFLADPEMRLDVGAIAKGYAAERIAEHLKDKNIEGYVVNIGGNVRTLGSYDKATPWKIGIENPTGGESNPYYAILEIENLSVVTSGSYQRFYTVNGKDYHHIISPDTLMPAEGYTSVSILCTDSGVADALSTALFCMSVEEGKKVLQSFSDVEAMWVKESGEIIYSDRFFNYSKGDNT